MRPLQLFDWSEKNGFVPACKVTSEPDLAGNSEIKFKPAPDSVLDGVDILLRAHADVETDATKIEARRERLKKFASHVYTFNPVGPGLPPPDARDHHDAPGAHAETTPSFKRSTVVMFPCSSGIRSLTKSQESSLGTNVRDVEPAAFLCRL